MRPILILLLLVVVVALAGIMTGFININQIRGAEAPAISATHNGLVAKGGQTPAFDVETGSVEVGSRNATVRIGYWLHKRWPGLAKIIGYGPPRDEKL